VTLGLMATSIYLMSAGIVQQILFHERL
jgi:hypothetical protein